MNKKSEGTRMAGSQNTFFNIRIPLKLKERFAAACEDRGAHQSKIGRQLLEAYCEAADEGLPLVGPFTIASKKKKK